MTGPSVGRVEAELRIDTSHVDADVKKGLEKAGADATHEQTGRRIGQDLTRGLERELETVGAPRAGAALTRGMRRIKAPAVPVHPVADVEEVTRFAERFGMLISNAFTRLGNSQFVKMGQNVGKAFEQGLGSIFNVSGKGPGGALMVVAIASLLYLVVGLIQGLNALSAVILTLPAALGAVALEVGVLYLAFKGLGTAITGAFAAKNAQELNDAIKGLTPEAQQFVKALLPLKDIFKGLERVSQAQLFASFNSTGAVQQLVSFLGSPTVSSTVAYLAYGLGQVFGSIIRGVSSPEFAKFVAVIGPAGNVWLRGFADALYTLMTGFNNLATAITPFFSSIGAGFNGVLTDFGNFLTRLSQDESFKQWLDDMRPVLTEFSDALMSIVLWLGATFVAFKKADEGMKKNFGKDTLENITAVFKSFAAFMASPEGVHTIQGLIEILGLAFASMAVGIFIIGQLLAAFDYLFRWVSYGIVGIVAFFTDLWHALTDGPNKAKNAFVEFIGAMTGLIGILIGIWSDFKKHAKEKFDEFIGYFTDTIPNAIENFAKGAINMLYDAGKNVIKGLINGIEDAIPGLGQAISDAAQFVKDHWPHSPAKVGPLSGSGSMVYAGQNLMTQLAAGIEMGIPQLQAATTNAAMTVNIGPGAINNTYNNANPAMAAQHAAAMYGQFTDMLSRDTRLAVRSMGLAR